jgi:hypothetical protein
MKRLFCVKDKNGKVMKPRLDGATYFEVKVHAKDYRDELNERLHKQAPFTVARGLDHWRGAS